jgi:phosphonate transport system permease protein
MNATPIPSINIEAPAPVRWRRLITTGIWFGIGVLLVWASFGTELSISKLISGASGSWALFFGAPDKPNTGFFPPSFERLGTFIDQMMLTIKMAIWGTVLAAIFAVPFSFLASRNTTPNGVVYQLARRFSDILRGVNELFLALIFVAAVGLGPFPGVLALAVGTAGTLIKLYSEAIEVVDPGQIEAVRASGASAWQVNTHAIWPQIVPSVISLTLYRFEANVRAAGVLGIVGAGGIGLYVQESMRSFNFPEAGALLIVILLAVFCVDFISAQIRQRLT